MKTAPLENAEKPCERAKDLIGAQEFGPVFTQAAKGGVLPMASKELLKMKKVLNQF